MGKSPAKRHDHAVELNPLLKPYGFCCNIKEADPRLQHPQKLVMPRFPSGNTTNEGPDIKIRFHEEDISSSALGQKGKNFGGGRGKNRNGRFFKSLIDRRRGRGRIDPAKLKRERMTCKRCRGPLKWYLEEEIAVALGIMINKRIEKYNTEMDRHVKIAKKKAKKKRSKKNKTVPNEAKEDTNETDEKTENN